MSQATRAMQSNGLGNAVSLPGSLQLIKGSSLKVSKKLVHGRKNMTSLSVRAVQNGGIEGHPVEVAAMVVPITMTSAILASAGNAQAVTAEDVAGALTEVQDASSQVAQTAGNAFEIVKDVFQKAFSALKPAIDVAVPYVQRTTDTALKAAAPVASDLGAQAEKALQSAGVDTKPVLDAAKTAVTVAGDAAGEATKYLEGAKPYASNTLENFLASDPLVLAEAAGALILVYFLAPAIFSGVAFAARGYKGDLTAAQALDLLSKEDYTLIDVRTEKEKSKSGVPNLPKNSKNKFIFIPVEELAGKLRGQLRNARKVEAEVAALKIASLKRIGKGSRVVIIDSSGDISKIVARALTGLGFKNTWVIVDGYDGGKGWVQSRLGTESYNSSFAEVLSPSRIMREGTKRFFSSASSSNDVVDVSPQSSNRLLPGGFDE